MKKWKGKTTILVLLALLFTMLIGAVQVNAETKPELSTTSVTVGINDTYSLYIYYQKDGATYSYVSSNKKVAKVSKKGVITGVKKGTTKVTVYQTYNKKKTKVGTVTVKVSLSQLYDTEGYWVSTQTGWISSKNSVNYSLDEFVQYMNPKATYKFYSSNSKKLKISTKGKITLAKGTGKVTVTIKENYKKKTRKVGSFKVSLEAPKLTNKGKTVSIYKTQTFDVDSYVKYIGTYHATWSEKNNLTKSELFKRADAGDNENDDDVLRRIDESEGTWHGTMRGLKKGTRYIYITAYNYKTKKFDQYLGMFTVKVKEQNTATSVFVDDENADNTAREGEILNIPIYADPYYYTGNIEVESSNPSVVSLCAIKQAELSEYTKMIASIYLRAGQEGTATVTVKLNGAECSFKVEVKRLSCYRDDTVTVDICNYLCETDTYPSSDDYKVESSNPDIAEGKVSGWSGDLVIDAYEEGTVTLTIYYKDQILTTMEVEVKDYDYDEDEE